MTAPEQVSRSSGTPRRHSLRWRLPLFFCALVVLMLASFLWIAFRQVETTLTTARRHDEITLKISVVAVVSACPS